MKRIMVYVMVFLGLFLCSCGKSEDDEAMGEENTSFTCEQICSMEFDNRSYVAVAIIDENRFAYINGENIVYIKNLDKSEEKVKQFDEETVLDMTLASGETVRESIEEEIDDTSNFFDDETCEWDESFLYELGDNDIKRPILDWSSLKLMADNVYFVKKFSDNNYLIGIMENVAECSFYHVYEAGAEEDHRNELVLAGVSLDDSLRKMVIEYNKTNTEYKISIRDYGMLEDPYTSLYLDFTTGKQIDILCLYELDVNKLVRNEQLLNLADRFDTDAYVNSYIDAIYYDDGIYEVAPKFAIYTMIGKESIVGGEMGWNYNEFKNMITANPNAEITYGATNYSLLNILLFNRISDFIDYENNESYFSSEECKEILEYIKYYHYDDEIDGNYFDKLYNDEVLLAEAFVSSGNDYRTYSAVLSDQLVFKGYPLNSGVGNYMWLVNPLGISSTSKYPDAAWDFLKMF